MLIEENEKKRQAQLANTAPVVHAPPVVQPAVQPGYVPQRRGAGRLRLPAISSTHGASRRELLSPGYAPQPGYAPMAPEPPSRPGATSPAATSPKGTEHTPNSPQTPAPTASSPSHILLHYRDLPLPSEVTTAHHYEPR